MALAERVGELSNTSNTIDGPHWTVQPFLKTFNAIPDVFITAICEILAVLALFVARKDVRRIRSNIRHVLGIPEGSLKSNRFIYQCLRHQVYVMFETLHLCLRPRRIQLEGLEEFRRIVHEAEDEGRGFAIVTAHLGNWEFVGHAAAIASRKPFYALAKPAPSKWFTDVLSAARRALSIQILWTGNRAIVSEMLSIPGHGMGIGFVMDQKPDRRLGHSCSFLGIPATFVGGPAMVVSKTGCPPISIFCIRTGRNAYRIISERIFSDSQQPKDQSELTKIFADKISAAILAHPVQWLWNYRRWKPEDLYANSRLPQPAK